jgi:peptidoglycan/LPS O-acetylase OafA/YrhL
LAHGVHLPPWLPHGFRGVDLFFVISGFCLSYPTLRGKAVSYGTFLLRRFTRIAPPYYVALALFAGLALTPFGLPTVLPSQITPPGAQAMELLRDFAFATPRVPIHNVVFWTLGIEARWYLVCPLLVALFLRSRPLFLGAALLCYMLYVGARGITDLGTLPCFMLGIVAAHLVATRHPLIRYAWLAALGGLTLGTWMQFRVPFDYGDPIWHFALFATVVAGSQGAWARALGWRPLRAVGLASYSIYLVHAPFLAWLKHHGTPGPLAIAAGLAAGFAFWRWVERPLASDTARRSFEDRVRGAFAPRRSPALEA